MRLMVALAMPLAVVLLAQVAPAVVLLDAELVAAGSPALENASGTVRLEQGRLDAIGRRTFVVPEPGAPWQLATGIALLLFLAKRPAQHAQKEDAMLKKHFRFCTPLLAILLMCLATPAFAQVPQDMTYTGRLVNDRGKPLSGSVNMELRIFDAEISGTQLYSEQHLSVPLDATCGFSVQLGLGTSPSGTFDASLFSEVDRWLEVVVNGEILTPRQIIGSVPWALVAERLAPQGGPGSDGQVLHVFDVNGRDLGLLAAGGPDSISIFIPGIGEAPTTRATGTVTERYVYFDSADCAGQAYVDDRLAGIVVMSNSRTRYFVGDIGETERVVMAPVYTQDGLLRCELVPGGIFGIPATEISPEDIGLPWPTPFYIDLAPEPAP